MFRSLVSVLTIFGVWTMPVDIKLERMADMKLNDIENTGYWSHDLSNGETLHDRKVEVGLDTKVGEVLYRSSGRCSSKDDIYKLWMDSPAHRKIITNSEYKFSVYKERIVDNGCYAIEVFSN